VQFAVGHAAEFRDGLTILAPVIERAREVHVKPLSEGLICQQPPIGEYHLHSCPRPGLH
jgi:hypothetical protein